MNSKDFTEKWERIGAQAEEDTPLVCVVAKFGKYEEVQVELPRRALPEVRRDVLRLGGGFRAMFI